MFSISDELINACVMRKYVIKNQDVNNIIHSIYWYNLKREDIETVDKEMIYEAVEDAIPSTMPGMKEKVKEYLDSLDN